jgi:hypothetical protein
MNFGDRVRVKAVAHRLKESAGSVHTTTRDHIRYGIAILDRAWAGEPVPGSDTPDIPRAVRVRRFPHDLEGIVIGLVTRHEGVVSPGGWEDPGHLGGPGYRRVPLYEVAIPATKLGKARIELVHEEDLEVL